MLKEDISFDMIQSQSGIIGLLLTFSMICPGQLLL